jgi:hypothetical protein
MTRFHAPDPTDADVVIGNAFPGDTSVYFMRKAMGPIERAPADATSVMIASNGDGLGFHGLYYPTHSPRMNAYRMRYERMAILERNVILQKIWKKLTRGTPALGESAGESAGETTTAESNANAASDASVAVEAPTQVQRSRHVWVYSPPGGYVGNGVDSMTITGSWQRILDEMGRGRSDQRVKVRIYPCSKLQCIGGKG